MRKIISMATIICVLYTMIISPVSADEYEPRNGYYIYTMEGEVYTQWTPSELGMISAPGSLVYASSQAFNQLLYTNVGTSYKDVYSCFGNYGGNESLTLGFNILDDYTWATDAETPLRAKVASHINYISAIGGVMTGYAFGWDTSGPYVNISWDIGGEHHYARFENALGYRPAIGYYDLMYKDGSSVQSDIAYMNETFRVPWESV